MRDVAFCFAQHSPNGTPNSHQRPLASLSGKSPVQHNLKHIRAVILCIRAVCALGFALSFCLAGVALAEPTKQKGASETKTQKSQGESAPVEVAALVVPQADGSARIALAYNRQVSHKRVRDEVQRLVLAGGWRLGNDLIVADDSVHGDNKTKYPITTGAMFTLLNAPQVNNGAPALLPYLQALQAWEHIEVLFNLPDITPYTGVENFESDPLTVRLLRGQGVYRYAADIRQHSGMLPALVTERKGAIGKGMEESGATSAKTTPSSPNWPLLLMGTGAALTGCALAYLFFARRSLRSSSARTLRP